MRASKRRLAERFGDTISAKLAFGSIDYVVLARSDGEQGCVRSPVKHAQRKHFRTPP
jgi:hypothetical protein